MPKKAPRNAFWFFMSEFKEQEERKGVKFPNGLRDVADAASPYWKNMSVAEKGVYERRAKEYKVQSQHTMEKYTSQGVSYSELERRENLKKQREEIELSEINSMINECFTKSQKIEDVIFYVIDVDVFCVTTGKEHVPCEISLAKFSLAEGVNQVFHTFVNPSIPAGYSFEARQVADKHGVTLPLQFGQSDSAAILAQIMDFLESDQDEYAKHPVFTVTKQIEKVKGVLEWLCYSVRNTNPETFRVYDLGKMFFALKNSIATNAKQSFPKETIAHAELTKDVFDFCRGLGCEIDEANDTAIHCTKAQVKRWCYIVCDHCCQLTGIPLIPGRHIPGNVDTQGSAKLSRPASKMTDYAYSDTMSTTSQMDASSEISEYISRVPNSTDGAWGRLTAHSRPSTQMSNHSEVGDTASETEGVNKRLAQMSIGNGASSTNTARAHSSKASYSSQVTRSTDGNYRRPYAPSGISKGLYFDSNDDFPTLGTTRGRGFVPSGRGRGNNHT